MSKKKSEKQMTHLHNELEVVGCRTYSGFDSLFAVGITIALMQALDVDNEESYRFQYTNITKDDKGSYQFTVLEAVA